jgi:signal peptidase I
MSDRAPSGIPTLRAVTDEHRAEVLRAMNRPRWRWRVFSEYAVIVIIAVAVFLVLRTFGVEAFKIPTGSMENTLLVGDFLLVNKAIYGAEIPFTDHHMPAFRKPERGDIIVFRWPRDPSKPFVKRLIGLPGDTLAMRDGVVYLDGQQQQEPYVLRSNVNNETSPEEFDWQRDFLVSRAEASVGYHPSRNNWGPLVVPAHEYFFLGDNRDNSYDSRYWGFVPDTMLLGRPLFVYYSYARKPTDAFPWLTDIRWARIGTEIH